MVILRKTLKSATKIVGALLTASIYFACSNRDDLLIQDYAGSSTPFNPEQTIVVDSFYPKSGSLGTRLIVYGSNFGNNVDRVKVSIGGVQSRVISVRGESLFCIVPSKADNGDIKVSVLDDSGNVLQVGECEKLFDFQARWVTSTFLGTMYDNNTEWDTKDGPFDDCGAFQQVRFMRFDTYADGRYDSYSHLYFSSQKTNVPFRHVDFSKKYVSTIVKPSEFINQEINAFDFTIDENHDMILAANRSNDIDMALYRGSRSSGFTEFEALCTGRAIKDVAINPQNGYAYFVSYKTGELKFIDLQTKQVRLAVGLEAQNTDYRLAWHPSGDYLYIIYTGKSCIYRADLATDGTLTNKHLVAGVFGSGGYIDGMGGSAKLRNPEQGVFVYNADYKGQEDEYDFYFCDRSNHCIRILTPSGQVSTYAGYIENGTPKNGYKDGALRTETFFDQPNAIAYDKERDCFYIGEKNNFFIRKIAQEE